MPRRRRRPPPSYWWRFVALIRRNPVKSLTAVLVVLGGIVPAVKGIQYLDDATDEWQLARHSFVYDKVGSVDKKAEAIGTQNQNILRDLQIDTASGKRAATVNELKRWQVELEKPGHDQRTTDLITQQIDALQTTRDRLDAQLKTLNTIKRN
jgi:hypothetical protein